MIKSQIGDKNGMQILLEFIAKLLDPSIPESSSIFVGELLVQVIQKVVFDF